MIGRSHQGSWEIMEEPEMITKLLVSGAIVLGAAVGLAAPAVAEPNAGAANPNPFSNVSCGCETPTSVTSMDVTDQINQGIHDSLTTDLPAVQVQGQP